MKGIINLCAVNLVKDNYGEDALKKVLKEANLPEDLEVLELENYDDEISINFINAAAKVLKVSSRDIMLAYGDYWVNKFAPKKFRIIYKKYTNARDFLKGMNDTHKWATSTIEDAKPPRFEYEDIGDNILVMHYFSDRKLDVILEGLVIGVLKYFNEKAFVENIESSKGGYRAIKITFEN